jgi:hypothetical protein
LKRTFISASGIHFFQVLIVKPKLMPLTPLARKKVEEVGGTNALQKTEMGPGMRRIAASRDTEGNIPGFHEVPKKSGK